jgi:hypothetical protein
MKSLLLIGVYGLMMVNLAAGGCGMLPAADSGEAETGAVTEPAETNGQATDKVGEIMDKAQDKVLNLLAGVEDRKGMIGTITGEMEKIDDEVIDTISGMEDMVDEAMEDMDGTGAGLKPGNAAAGNPEDGNWLLKATPGKTAAGGCAPFEISFRIRNGAIQQVRSPEYGYISQDFAAGKGSVTLGTGGALEIVIGRDTITGRLGGSSGSGEWVSAGSQEDDTCRGTWQAGLE